MPFKIKLLTNLIGATLKGKNKIPILKGETVKIKLCQTCKKFKSPNFDAYDHFLF